MIDMLSAQARLLKPLIMALTALALLATTLPVLTPSAQAQQRSTRKKYKPARLVIITNFDRATVTVNGKPYPSYVLEGDEEGMVLPAGGPYQVEVRFDGKVHGYTISLRPNEVRYMVLDLSGLKGGTSTASLPSPSAPVPDAPKPPDDSKEEGDGKVTAYAKPRGSIIVDGKDTGKMAPNSVDLEAGRHEIQVKYENGELSEKKIVRVRKGSSIKLFFRQKTQ